MALYKELPGHVYEKASALGLQSRISVDSDYVASFLQRHLPEDRLTKGEDKDLKFKFQSLEKWKKKKQKNVVKKRRNGLSSKDRKRLKLFDIKKEHQTYAKYLPMHRLWKQYIADVLDVNKMTDSNIPAVQEKLLKADFHGSCLTVQRSKCPSYVGVSGIVLQETRNMFKVITKDDQVKCIPKMNSVFALEIGSYMFSIHGNQFRVRSAERCTRKFKLKGTIEL